MIEIITSVHDKFSIEFKIGFIVEDVVKENHFSINTWIFVPNSLDITPYTYNKEQFYRDVKSNVRLITPSFPLNHIAGEDSLPRLKLQNSIERLAADTSHDQIADYEYHIKMYSAIVRSAIRNASHLIRNTSDISDIKAMVTTFAADSEKVIKTYRNMWSIIADSPCLSQSARDSYSFGDEFMSRIIEYHSFRILNKIDKIDKSRERKELAGVRKSVVDLIRREIGYKHQQGYAMVMDDERQNRNLVFRQGILKKYVESDLYIQLHKKKDGVAVEQILYSIAAGVAMIFATIVAFSAQRKFGNFSMPLFVALVVSYMLKDRIKDLMRYYFAHRLSDKYFDNKADINIKGQNVGWLKEAVDFINDHRTPQEVLEIRNRSSLLEAENKIFDEKIMLYRKRVYIDRDELNKHNDYPLIGINNIFRLNFHSFTLKMDDSNVKLDRLNDDDDEIEVIHTDKIYYVNLIIQFQYEEHIELRRFRITLSRNGIIDVEKFG